MALPIMLPSMLLSGFLFPVSAMPIFLQMVGRVLPLTYFIAILRGVVIKGVGFSLLMPEIIALIVLAIGLLAAAALRFRKTLD